MGRESQGVTIWRYKEIFIYTFVYLYEIRTENPCVPGSIPGPGTSKFKGLSDFCLTPFSFRSMPVLCRPSIAVQVNMTTGR